MTEQDVQGLDPETSENRPGVMVRIRSSISRLQAWFRGLTQRQRLLAAIAAVSAMILLVAGVLIWYLIFRKPISSLPGLNVNLPPNYSYSISGIDRPLGVAVDRERARVYVSQSGGSRRVLIFDIEGNPLGELIPPNPNRPHTPTYVAVNQATGNVYVSDRGVNALYVYAADGTLIGTLTPKGANTFGPLGVAVDSSGIVYVADANAGPQVVWALKSDGTVVRKFGETAGLSYPNGVAVSDDGTVFVADSNNTRVVVFNADASIRGILARGDADAPMGLTRGLAIGDNGRLYVVDTTNNIVRVYSADRSGIPVFGTLFGDSGQLDGQFNFPNGIATDSHGHIFVTDRENNRLQVWTNP